MSIAFRLIFLFAILDISLLAKIDDKIESTQVNIDSKKDQERVISSKLNSIASDIKKHTRMINKINEDIKATKKSIKELNKKSFIKAKELKKIEKLYKKLEKNEKLISKKVIDILSKELAIDIITNPDLVSDEIENRKYDKSVDDIVMNEVLSTYTTILKNNFKKEKSKYIKLNKSIDLIKNEIYKLSNKVNILKEKKATLDTLKKRQKRIVLTLKNDKKRYLSRLNRIREEQNSLIKTLSKLNIIKKRELQTRIKADKDGNINVRQIGSSYTHSKLLKYRGPKTISPLKSYTVVQDFGNYTDPIYHIKVFNDSVILRSKQKDAKVYNILNGEVIYAQKSPMLGYLVIMKNRSNIHTIYANLSKIAPTIKVGRYLKKGYVIGKVERELRFEVTKNDMHLNPLRLIR